MKEVLYNGVIYQVPLWATYLARDLDDSVYAFSHKPRFNKAIWIFDEGRCKEVYIKNPAFGPHEDSLVEI